MQIWLLSGPARSGGFSDEAICAGLDGAANLKIAASSGGRANRPYQKLSTVHPLAGTSCVLRTGSLRSIASSVHLPEKSQASTSTATLTALLRCLPPSPALLTSATNAADARRQRCRTIGTFKSSPQHKAPTTGIPAQTPTLVHQGQSDQSAPPGTDSEISHSLSRPSAPNVSRCSRTETAAFDIVTPIL